jgi:FkbM family methyltransferase
LTFYWRLWNIPLANEGTMDISFSDLILDDFAGAIKWHYETQTEPHEEEFRIFSHFAGPDEVFLDIGANIGNSVVSFRLFNKSCKIVSFEPSPWLKPAMDWLKAKEGERFDYFMVGAGSKNERKEIFIPCLDRKPNFYLASFAGHRFGPDPRAIQGMKNLMGTTPEGVYSVCRHEVDIKPIDSYGIAPTIVKMDTETFEIETLRGMVKTLSTNRPLVMIEGANRDHEVVTLFNNLAYQFSEYDRGKLLLTKEISQSTNGFFVADERIDEYRQRGVIGRP